MRAKWKPKPVCNRCGKCCYIRHNGAKYVCPFMMKKGDITVCAIYRNRKGAVTAQFGIITYRCFDRKDMPFDFPGCPYNTGKPMIED